MIGIQLNDLSPLYCGNLRLPEKQIKENKIAKETVKIYSLQLS